MTKRASRPQVHKFGGASLADATAVKHAVALIVRHRAEPTVVVLSAMAGVTDALLDIAKRAVAGDVVGALRESARLRARHVDVARSVLRGASQRAEVVRAIDDSFRELDTLVRGLDAVRELTARTTDLIVARGERLSATLVAAALRAERVKGRYVDATRVIHTDDSFQSATPDLAATDRAARAVIRPLLARGEIAIVPGFLGVSPDGAVTTLGRGGSDLSATLLARALNAHAVSLWKDVPGLLTSDPRLVPHTSVIAQLHPREAAELAYYGAKVLHPRALIPLTRRAMPLFVRPFANPESTGTEVSARRTMQRYPVKALSISADQAMITVAGNGMLGVPGISARTFGTLQREGISVSLISQASSEHSICFSVPAAAAARARNGLSHEFRHEIANREIDSVTSRDDVATIAIVGLGIGDMPGTASRVFEALSTGGINVVAIAQGSSELNLSVVVDATNGVTALRRIHTAFQLDRIGGGGLIAGAHVDAVLLGYGSIGQRVAAQIARNGRKSGAPRVVAIIDRSGYLFDAGGLSAVRLATASKAKRAGRAIATLPGATASTTAASLAHIARHALSHPVCIDVTAEDTMSLLMDAVRSGMDLVMANKRPLSGPRARVRELRALAAERGARIRAETTVGAALPILDTYAKLVESGDRVRRIEACPSGTLGFLFDELGRGRKFSAALRDAMSRGYTEPDPRDDLTGMDVARKGLILGRLLGFEGELSDVTVESLVTPAAAKMPLAKFLAQLETLDDAWDARVAKAKARGGVLRYQVNATARKVSVGLVVADESSPMASLRGTDNQFVFVSDRYKSNPMVISGPGAGPDVTASGVVNDVLQLARRR
ncbi:MAG TPA: aspartate kinase [Gemmatimonadaceae bacterium]|nr:aspartate kinase [Gemmatimonadaceae bacterium]